MFQSLPSPQGVFILSRNCLSFLYPTLEKVSWHYYRYHVTRQTVDQIRIVCLFAPLPHYLPNIQAPICNVTLLVGSFSLTRLTSNQISNDKCVLLPQAPTYLLIGVSLNDHHFSQSNFIRPLAVFNWILDNGWLNFYLAKLSFIMKRLNLRC